MTLRERAEKILGIVRNPDTIYECQIDMAESELKAAVDEAVAEINSKWNGAIQRCAHDEEVNEALEKAAQVAINRAHGLAGEVQAAKDIAVTIRALKGVA